METCLLSDLNATLQRMITRCPGFEAAWNEGVASRIETAGQYNELAALAKWTVQSIGISERDCLMPVFAEVEHILESGVDAEVREMVVVGFLEEVLHLCREEGIDESRVASVLGPVTSGTWSELIRRLSGTDTR
jgi:hypothetical protein